ncbi:disease resistance protein [Pyrus ussuriensis x Pyrus communis]|uniref:Disease resistance protein n=1 Tax=Pyrus ussuriensis x Pyrus communis TaxID=2448454 RepID=A0A5N5FSG6_9ROSA|nr:disease resistance protein [Pyrus ussuriensis x Pyrus communis]
MEFLSAAVSGIVGKVLELTIQPVGRQAGYIFHHKINLKNLESQLDNLGASRNRVQHTVNEVKRKGRNLSKKSKKMVKAVLQLHANKEFPRFSFKAPPQEIWSIPTEEYEAFESRAFTVKKIMEELRNPNTNMIGVYGIGGVGKTTLIKEVFRQATKEELFDDVVLVLDVKQNPDLERIQKEIAENWKSADLCDRLRDTEILVILDDVWERIDLEALGLPRRVCKILLTCRSREILSSEMRTQKEFGLHVLGEEETWSLFEKMAARNALHSLVEKLKDACLLLDGYDNTSVRMHDLVKELKVLDLTNLRIPSLPPSLQFLTSLQTLCLDLCVLGDIALLGQLRNLEILSLLESQVKQLPKEIGQLSRLRLLDLSGCSEIEVISPGVISSLERLEDLRMGNSFNQWEEEGVNVERSNASLSELKHLSRLSSLDIHIPDANILPENLFSDKLERYHILVGDAWKWHGVDETFNTLKLKLTASNQLDGGLKMLLKRSEDLYFDVLEGVNNIVYHLDSEGLFQQLKHLHVQNNAETTYIINSVNWSYSHNAFPILESLFLDNLVSLESVCYGQLTAESFRQLRIIKVESCHKLRNLFSFSVARCFLQLQEIEVENCETMTEIVAEEREDNFGDEAVDPLEFFQLRSLTFRCLPNLIGFSSKGSKPVVTTGLDEQLTNGEFNKIILENEIGRPVQQFMNGQVCSLVSIL